MKNRIKEIRDDRDLSQEDLADLVGTSQAQIGRLENGERKFTIEWAKRLAVPLECHWAELVEETSPMSKREKAILDLTRGMTEATQETFLSLGNALAKRPTGADPDDDENSNNDIKKKSA